MTVDEENLKLIISDLQTKLTTKSDEKKNIRIILESAGSIKMINQADPTDEDPNNTIDVLPQDDDLKSTITDERRNKIYDKIVLDASQI